MDSGKSPLTVILAPQAEEDLWGIWGYNAGRYGVDHADEFFDFLKTGINRLSLDYQTSRPLEMYPEYRFVTLRKGRRGHGYFVIFKVDEAVKVLKVLHIYHTSMDVNRRLGSEST